MARRQALREAGKTPGGKDPRPPEPGPRDGDQVNLTDQDSRIMPRSGGGFDQGYNARAAVDAKAQIIVAHGLSDCSADSDQLEPMVKAIRANTGRNPAQFSADAGYCSDASLAILDRQKINAFIATGR